MLQALSVPSWVSGWNSLPTVTTSVFIHFLNRYLLASPQIPHRIFFHLVTPNDPGARSNGFFFLPFSSEFTLPLLPDKTAPLSSLLALHGGLIFLCPWHSLEWHPQLSPLYMLGLSLGNLCPPSPDVFGTWDLQITSLSGMLISVHTDWWVPLFVFPIQKASATYQTLKSSFSPSHSSFKPNYHSVNCTSIHSKKWGNHPWFPPHFSLPYMLLVTKAYWSYILNDLGTFF